MQPVDIPAPLAALGVTAVVWAITYLATVNWIQPRRRLRPRHTNDPETR